jgi:hypothetical protein
MSEDEVKKVEDAEAVPEKVASELRSKRGPRGGGSKTCYNCGKVRTN